MALVTDEGAKLIAEGVVAIWGWLREGQRQLCAVVESWRNTEVLPVQGGIGEPAMPRVV